MTTDTQDLLTRLVDTLEDENLALQNELLELRGPVPPFPDEIYATHPSIYIKIFNQLRHLKEIPQ